MRGNLVLIGILISTIIACVLSDGEVAASDQTHVRTKRSPYDPIVPTLLLGKSFLLGALVGKGLGWRRRGWGWRPRVHGWSRPVVVSHVHSHGGWGGWEEPVSHGWGGWSR